MENQQQQNPTPHDLKEERVSKPVITLKKKGSEPNLPVLRD